MTEQIIDLQEGVMPGPRGDQGPRGSQGLPGVNAVPADDAVAGYITSDSRTASALADRYAPRDKRDMMVVFGDSMTVCGTSSEKQWWHIVATKLCLKVKNYGNGGSGFVTVHNGINYDTELTAAINDTNIDKTKVKYVFVNASTNDDVMGDQAAAVAAAWSERCKAAYPNAQYIAFAGLFGANVRHKNHQHRLTNPMRQFELVAQTLAADGWHVFTNSPFWLVFNRGLTQLDTLHPNDKGLEVIANYVLSGIQSGVYTSISHSMGAIKPVSLTPLQDGADKTAWMQSLIDSGFVSADHAGAQWPFANLKHDFCAWQSLPDINSIVFYFSRLVTSLTATDVNKFATNWYTIPATVHGGSSDITIPIGLDIPICPLPYPFGWENVHGQAINRWTDGLDVWINGKRGVVGACLYQTRNAKSMTPNDDARHWLWLHFDYAPFIKRNFFAYNSAAHTSIEGQSGMLGCYNLQEGVASMGVLNVTINGRILYPIAGLWRP